MKQTFLDEFGDEDSFYDINYIEECMSNDEINSEEEGFMIGYLS